MNIRQEKYKANRIAGMNAYNAGRAAGYSHNYASKQSKRIERVVKITPEDILKTPPIKIVKNNYIYIIKVDNYSYYKIGITTDIYARFSGLQTANPFKLSIIYTIEGDIKAEKNIHKAYKNKRVRGEWFNLHKEDVKDIIRVLNEPTPKEV